MDASCKQQTSIRRGDAALGPDWVLRQRRIRRVAKYKAKAARLQVKTEEATQRDGGGNAVVRHKSGSGGYRGYDARGGRNDANRSGRDDARGGSNGLVTGIHLLTMLKRIYSILV